MIVRDEKLQQVQVRAETTRLRHRRCRPERRHARTEGVILSAGMRELKVSS
jgi:hypothetical protein